MRTTRGGHNLTVKGYTMAELPIEPQTPATPPVDPVVVANATPDATSKKKKSSVCSKTFIQLDGSRGAHATPETDALEFAFTNGITHVVREEDYTEAINRCFGWMGKSEKLGNGYAGARKVAEEDLGRDATDEEVADYAEELYGTLNEQLVDGDWVKTGEGGGVRPSMLVDAIVACLESEGTTVDDERRKEIALKLKADSADNPYTVVGTTDIMVNPTLSIGDPLPEFATDDDGKVAEKTQWKSADQLRKKALANPAINAAYESIKKAAQDAKTAAAVAKAEEDSTPLTGF